MKRLIIMVLSILAVLLLTAGCQPNAPSQQSPPVSAEKPDDTRLFESVEDAGLLGTALEQNEKETFAGFWTAGGRIFVAAFTRDGEETLKKYIKEGSPLSKAVLVQTLKVPFAELQAEQQETMEILKRHGLSFSSSIDVRKNQVELLVTDSEIFNQALEGSGEKLPEHVEVVVTYEPLREIAFPINPDPSVHFPQLKTRSAVFMTALMVGELRLSEDGYLRVRDTLIIWQPDYFVNSNNGKIEILDREGKVVGRVGEEIYMGGGNIGPLESIDSSQLTEPLPSDIKGSIWLQGGGTRLNLNLSK